MNPEFGRNLRVEISPYRLMAMTLTLALIFLLVHMASGPLSGATNSALAQIMFIAIAVIWGSRLAAGSVLQEIRANTWDSQKLSALSPWQMTWGKLLGSTSYVWFGGMLCGAVYLIYRNQIDEQAVKTVVAMLQFGLLVHALSMASSLIAIRKNPKAPSSLLTLAEPITAFVAAVFVFTSLQRGAPIVWFGITTARLDFYTIVLALGCCWAVAAVYRLMCVELQIRTIPWLWPVFTLFVAGYWAGLEAGESQHFSLHALLQTGFWFALVFTYIAAFADRRDPITVHRCLLAWRYGSLRRRLEEFPYWTSSFALALVLAAVLAITSPSTAGDGSLRLATWPALLVAVRDIGLLYYTGFGRRSVTADMTAFLYLALLHKLIPGLLQLTRLDGLAPFVDPLLHPNPILALIITLAHCAVVAWLLRGRWYARTAPLREVAAA